MIKEDRPTQDDKKICFEIRCGLAQHGVYFNGSNIGDCSLWKNSKFIKRCPCLKCLLANICKKGCEEYNNLIEEVNSFPSSS